MRPLILITCFFLLHGCRSSTTSKSSCLKEKAVIEMGTNRLKFIYAEVNTCKKVISKEIIKKTWMIEQDEVVFKDREGSIGMTHKSKDQTLAALEQIKDIFPKEDAFLEIIATGIFREVDNLGAFFNKVEAMFGTKPKILSALQEAKLSHRSLQLTEKNLPQDYLVWDIGGNSTQIVHKDGEKISYILGGKGSQFYKNQVMALLRRQKSPNPIQKLNIKKVKTFVRTIHAEFIDRIPFHKTITLFGVGGTHNKGLLAEINQFKNSNANSYSRSDLNQFILDTAEMTDGQLGGKYAANRVVNAIFVEDILDQLNQNSVEVRDITLTKAVLIDGL